MKRIDTMIKNAKQIVRKRTKQLFTSVIVYDVQINKWSVSMSFLDPGSIGGIQNARMEFNTLEEAEADIAALADAYPCENGEPIVVQIVSADDKGCGMNGEN